MAPLPGVFLGGAQAEAVAGLAWPSRYSFSAEYASRGSAMSTTPFSNCARDELIEADPLNHRHFRGTSVQAPREPQEELPARIVLRQGWRNRFTLFVLHAEPPHGCVFQVPADLMGILSFSKTARKFQYLGTESPTRVRNNDPCKGFLQNLSSPLYPLIHFFGSGHFVFSYRS